MISRYTMEATQQRLQETEEAIAEQRKHLETLTDPDLRTIAARTLATLEDIALIMRRTRGLLAESAGTRLAEDLRDEPDAGRGPRGH